MPEGAERPPHVGGQQVQRFFSLRGEAVDGQVAFEQHDRQARGALKVHQVAIELVEDGVPIGHFLVDRGQLFVGGLQLFLRGFQFFVDALEFFVGGRDFFVGGLDLFVGRFLLFLDGLKIIARLGLFALQFGDAAVRGSKSTPHRGPLAGQSGRTCGRLQRFQYGRILLCAGGFALAVVLVATAASLAGGVLAFGWRPLTVLDLQHTSAFFVATTTLTPGAALARVWGSFLLFSAYRLTVQAIRQPQRTP